MEDYVVSIPPRDFSLMEELFARMGWKVRPRRASIENFIKSCPTSPVMTDEEITAEVNAVRYGEWKQFHIEIFWLFEFINPLKPKSKQEN